VPWSNKTVVFDLDGTLVDTAPDLHASLCYCFKQKGLEAVSLETIRHSIGHGAKFMIERSAKLSGLTLSEDLVSELHRLFLDYYVSHIADHSRPFEGILDCLDYCTSMNARLAVCTNKTQVLAEEVLETLNLSSYFHAIVGADRASKKKPSPAHLNEAVGLADGLLEGSIMIGDSSTDGFAAQASGVPFILMTYGYLDDRLDEVNCAYRLSSAKELIVTLEDHFSLPS
tara:strand:- start:28861 stop:29544 length:684 start_codon:yes stop_codon:yes gene_type:complete